MALTVALWSSVVVLVVLLVTPIQVRAVVERERDIRAQVWLSWLFGLVRFRVHPSARDSAPRKERPSRSGSRGGRIAERVVKGLRDPDLRSRSMRFLRDALRALRLRDARLWARIGLDDPADTGRLWAVLGPLGSALRNRNVRLEPAFDEGCLRFEAAARVRLVPAQLFFLTAAFLMSPPVVRALVAR